jgi:hypothetical protein
MSGFLLRNSKALIADVLLQVLMCVPSHTAVEVVFVVWHPGDVLGKIFLVELLWGHILVSPADEAIRGGVSHRRGRTDISLKYASICDLLLLLNFYGLLSLLLLLLEVLFKVCSLSKAILFEIISSVWVVHHHDPFLHLRGHPRGISHLLKHLRLAPFLTLRVLFTNNYSFLFGLYFLL